MFRRGQFVECVDAKGVDLCVGGIYRVTAIRETFIEVEGFGSLQFPGFFPSRFRPAPDISALKAILNVQQPAEQSA